MNKYAVYTERLHKPIIVDAAEYRTHFKERVHSFYREYENGGLRLLSEVLCVPVSGTVIVTLENELSPTDDTPQDKEV